MASYESPGTENLRADAHQYGGKLTDSPSGDGKDAGVGRAVRALQDALGEDDVWIVAP